MTRSIEINKRRVVVLHFNEEEDSLKKLEEAVSKHYLNLESFFNIKVPLVNIKLLYSRKEIDEKFGQKTPSWIIGFINKNIKENTVYLLSPSLVKRLSPHKENEIYKVLIHELSHVFSRKINRNTLKWVNEGIALYLAKQVRKGKIKKSDWEIFFNNEFSGKKPNLSLFSKHNGYKISFILIKIIIEEYGKEKALQLLNIDTKKIDVHKKIEAILDLDIDKFKRKVKK